MDYKELRRLAEIAGKQSSLMAQWDSLAQFHNAASPSVVLALLEEIESKQWISVEDRLPQPYEEVMVWPYPSDYCMTAQWWRGNNVWKYGDYIAGHGHEWVEAHGITHWMPLPNAPVVSPQEKEEVK